MQLVFASSRSCVVMASGFGGELPSCSSVPGTWTPLEEQSADAKKCWLGYVEGADSISCAVCCLLEPDQWWWVATGGELHEASPHSPAASHFWWYRCWWF
ncbi:hypothetical protein L209DRAFT_472660 [Thermothelomyces heterothallicus CBS 203.75]